MNDAVYVAKYEDAHHDKEGNEYWWTSTGTQFKVPYVFKSMFSHDPIEFKDLCETKTVQVGNMYLDINENLPEGEHKYNFVGRVGEFCPIIPGKGGGILLVFRNDKYDAVAGTKGFRWLESETVKELNKEHIIDRSYYDELVNKAVEAISEYCDYDWFAD